MIVLFVPLPITLFSSEISVVNRTRDKPVGNKKKRHDEKFDETGPVLVPQSDVEVDTLAVVDSGARENGPQTSSFGSHPVGCQTGQAWCLRTVFFGDLFCERESWANSKMVRKKDEKMSSCRSWDRDVVTVLGSRHRENREMELMSLVARELESRLPRKAWTTRHCQNPARA